MKVEMGNQAVYPMIVPVSNRLKSINFYLYQNDQTLTLIDAGINTEECWGALLKTLKTYGFSLENITQIILTHHHSDHVGLVDRITSQHPIPVYAHPYAIPRLQRDEDFMQRRVNFFETLYEEGSCGDEGRKQVEYLKKAIHKNKQKALQTDILPLNVGSNPEVIEMPGHAPDQVSLYQENTGWLFGGDLLIHHISSNALVEPDCNGERKQPLLQHIESLRKTLALQPDIIFPGHGSVIKKPSILIEKRLTDIDDKATTLSNFITEGITTVSQLAKNYYGEKYTSQFPLVISEIIGHLDYLESLNRIKKEKMDGIWHYIPMNN
ncbi:glyoxylase-like metal-dependent hydrolase (beta-lactamase superfamily II) [Geomicrobium halophilum]|uniref:Glyoxylase-like metal-dependent hydrolase (Beta-lactamase superfamily II) n=1 Tax=Geomicrobium halophilum TaxID=549000 RepID=A0A841PVF9_9BACL|nr:MBL fold metallo-hydrolase [Geomicrobium halophilum]MBB6450301.1 glyoxylase-like metal-dependent hydrolase (beta-lactamase superfamily II) [Geomicrobium halophilum]